MSGNASGRGHLTVVARRLMRHTNVGVPGLVLAQGRWVAGWASGGVTFPLLRLHHLLGTTVAARDVTLGIHASCASVGL